MKKILYPKTHAYVVPFVDKVNTMNRKTCILFALEAAKAHVELLPPQFRYDAQTTLDLATAWSKGESKMPIAKASILALHKLAKQSDDALIEARLRAIAHAASTVHVKTHALGLLVYGLTATEYAGWDVNKEVARLWELLLYYEKQPLDPSRSWAVFLQQK